MRRLLPLLVIGLPVLELLGLVWIGQRVGGLVVLGWIATTAVVGLALIRWGRTQMPKALASALDLGAQAGTTSAAPAVVLARPVAAIASGVLLLVPGVLTDVVGLVLLVPGPRTWIARQLTARATARAAQWVSVPTAFGGMGMPDLRGFGGPPADGGIIDVDAADVEIR